MERIERNLDRVSFDLVSLQASHSIFEEEHKKFLERMRASEERMRASEERMDRFEEQFERGYQQLLTAQVVMNDEMKKSRKEHDERMRHIDERLDALIAVVDGNVRKSPPPLQ